METDIQISRSTPLKSIYAIAEQINIDEDNIIPYGKYKAKVALSEIDEERVKRANLILVTAITPNKAGVGKTVTSVGLSLGLSKLGKNAVVALREPSLGPCFGMKGGAAGGGFSQVLPMEDINLHFTGDFHAITSANNMIAALLDNYQYQNRNTGNALAEIVWKRVLDINDRSLRQIISGLGSNGIPQETGFDITTASEIMALLCLASSLEDLENRVNSILLGYRRDKTPFYVKDLGVGSAITVLLKDALLPNLVQTTENTAAFIHGGPFANIAHGCNSVLATKMAMSHADYVVTEAGFGADLGAEKFLDIKCRIAGLKPKATVIAVTTLSLKLHGGQNEKELKQPNLQALKGGMPNLKRHVENMQNFGQNIVVALNQHNTDTEEEINYVKEWCKQNNVAFAVSNCFAYGGDGALELAAEVIKVIDEYDSTPINFTYDLHDDISIKIAKVASKIYRAASVKFSAKAQKKLTSIRNNGWNNLPVCIAKTQYSFADDPQMGPVPDNFVFEVQDLVVNTGAGFVVAIAGDIMRMPGLPKEPAALQIGLKNGFIEGLS
ncbi:formate--tetrahydrofolate ligase [Solitalea canadensis]|uniref:Formate--tetrahydrofolate ligase n=1 Tax=Solitalea canadensis (strain ATCC 29591 / DSM 3403 / JCM 21819 / LMG 8368 / NBRC 15130 / NCIMB 12057 / USAM 9D) TaxID=929556 RepID=H8KNN2_SOLCM|nr:formate--tetrahydrofolate ligase [Solitalea canadensis]AFD08165.1 formyltetrahydrofolate synthetase [Solitalea canadensis DSM 3403]